MWVVDSWLYLLVLLVATRLAAAPVSVALSLTIIIVSAEHWKSGYFYRPSFLHRFQLSANHTVLV